MVIRYKVICFFYQKHHYCHKGFGTLKLILVNIRYYSIFQVIHSYDR